MNADELCVDELRGDVGECLIGDSVGPRVFAGADHKHRRSVPR